MKSSASKPKIPETGRIGRFARIVKEFTDNETFLRIMKDSGDYGKYNSARKASWWRQAVEKLENELGTVKTIEIMRACGSKCCGQGTRKTAKRLMNESASVEEFLGKLNALAVKENDLEFRMKDKNTITGWYNRCLCGQVKNIKELFKNITYCECSAEFNKHFFEAALNKPVEVKVLQSIISGSDHCEFEIKI